MMRLFGWILLFFALSSCYHPASAPEFNMDLVLPEDSMVTLLSDLHTAEGVVNVLKSKEMPAGHLSSEYFEAVLQKHSVSRDAFEESMRYYAYYSEKLDKIYEKVITDLSLKESLARPAKEEQNPVD